MPKFKVKRRACLFHVIAVLMGSLLLLRPPNTIAIPFFIFPYTLKKYNPNFRLPLKLSVLIIQILWNPFVEKAQIVKRIQKTIFLKFRKLLWKEEALKRLRNNYTAEQSIFELQSKVRASLKKTLIINLN